MVAGQLGLKSRQTRSQLGPVYFQSVHGSIHDIWFEFCIIFRTKSKINIKQLLTNIAIKLLIDRIEGGLAT